MIVEILILLGLLALFSISFKKPARMPPGSFGLPIVGELPPSGVTISQHFAGLMKQRGSIYTTKWGSYPIVVLADFDLMKKALYHPDLQGRPKSFSDGIFILTENTGVVNSEGPRWAENRRFLLRHLRDLGMGKTALEDSIQDEAAMLVDHLEKTCVGKPAVMDVFINGAVVNVIWQMLASKRYDINDKEILEYNRVVEENFTITQETLSLLNYFPWFAKILPTFIFNKIMKMDVVMKNRNHIFEMFKEPVVGVRFINRSYPACFTTLSVQEFASKNVPARVIKEHMKTLDENSPRDLIDHYLLTYPVRDANGYLTPENEKNFLAMMGNMFAAGSETTSSTLRWMILYMAINPEIQAKIHKLLDEVVPKERLPSLSDRNQLQYVDAMLLDVMRLSSLFPFTLPHKATADVEFEGYIIPMGTTILACAEICHHDPAVWEKPNDLHPDHFLDQDRNLNCKKDNFLPFSVGRRQCLGESLARMELFLFSAAILQRFTIEPPEGVTIVPEKKPGQIFFGFPTSFEVVLHKRM